MAPEESDVVQGMLQVTIKGCQVSSKLNLSAAIEASLRDLSVELQFPFFQTPRNCANVPPTPEAFEEQVQILTEWIESRFPSCFLPSYPRALAQKTLSYVYGSGARELSPGTSLFDSACHMAVVGFIGDDLWDKDQGEWLRTEYHMKLDGLNATLVGSYHGTKQWRRFGISDGGAMQRSQNSAPGLVAKLFGFFLRYALPFLRPRSHASWKLVVGRLSSWFQPKSLSVDAKEALRLTTQSPLVYGMVVTGFEVMGSSKATCTEMAQMCFASCNPFITNAWRNDHLAGRSEEEVVFCDETYRFFRSEDSGFMYIVDAVYHWTYGYLPSWTYHSAILRHFQTLANSIAAGINDIAGFQKDLASCELGSMVLFEIITKGGSPGEVLQVEANRIGQTVKDYLWFRNNLLQTFGDEVEKYVALVDSGLCGYMQGMNYDKRFAVGGGKKMRFVET